MRGLGEAIRAGTLQSFVGNFYAARDVGEDEQQGR